MESPAKQENDPKWSGDTSSVLRNFVSALAANFGATEVCFTSSMEGAWPPITVSSRPDDKEDADLPVSTADNYLEAEARYGPEVVGRLVVRGAALPIPEEQLAQFAEVAGSLWGQAYELAQATEAREERSVLRAFGLEMGESSELEHQLSGVVTKARQLLRADYASIAVIEKDGSSSWVVMDGNRTDVHKNVVFPFGEGTASRTAAARKPVILQGIGQSSELPPEEFPLHIAEGGVSVLSVPLLSGGKAVGALIISSRTPRQWSQSEIELCSVFANGAGMMIEVMRASEAEKSDRLFLEKAIEHFPGIFLVLEPPEWRFRVANSNFNLLLGEPYQSGEPVLGKTVRDVVSEWTERSEAMMQMLRQVAETGEALTFEQYESDNPQLGRTYWNWSALPIGGASKGSLRSVMLIAHNVTDKVLAFEQAQQAAEVARARAEELEATIRQMADGLIIFDASGQVSKINPVGRRLLGRGVINQVDPSQYSELYDIYTPEGERYDPDELPAARALRGETVVGAQLLVRRPNGEEAIISVSASPLTDSKGSINGVVAVMRDVTQEKLVEKLKDEFLSVVSHELRTPLSAIIGYSDLLLRGVHGALAERQAKSLRAVRANADRLLDLINDLLDVSRLESGSMPIETAPLEISDLVERTITQTRIIAVARGVSVENNLAAKRLPQVLADEPRLQQVIENLLTNAIKFTPAGGTVAFEGISSRLAANDPALYEGEVEAQVVTGGTALSLVITVKDTGAGLENRDLERIWDRFYQVDSTAKRKSGGAGLGLAIVRSLVELHGGQVWAQSAGKDKGSSFSFSLPVAPAQEAGQAQTAGKPKKRHAAPQPDASQPGKSGDEECVLVVEDDADQREIISDMLELEGYSVAFATDGEEAIEQATSIDPCAIILDVLLPRADGWQVLLRLRQNPSTNHIPVLIISVVDQAEFGKKLGATEYLLKPIDPAGLRSVMRRMVGRSNRGQEAQAAVRDS